MDADIVDVDLFEIQIIEKNGSASVILGGWKVVSHVPSISIQMNPGLWLFTPEVDRTYYTETIFILNMNYIPSPSDSDVDTYYLYRDLLVKRLKNQHYI